MSNLSVSFLCIKSSIAWFNRAYIIMLRNQFLIHRIVQADLSITAFVAEDTRYNLKSTVISEFNSLSAPEHCFM